MPTEELFGKFDAPEEGATAPAEGAEAPAEHADLLDRLIPDLKNTRERLDKNKDDEKYDALDKELIEIEKLEGEAQKKPLFDFRSANTEILLTEAECAQFQSQAAGLLDLKSGVTPDEPVRPHAPETEFPVLDISDELKEKAVWTEDELKSVTDGTLIPPEGYFRVDEGSDENFKIATFEELEAMNEGAMTVFLEANNLKTPAELVKSVERLVSSAYMGDFSHGERYTVTVLKNEAGIDIQMSDTKFNAEEGATEEWETYQKAVQEELKTAELTGLAKEHEAAEGEAAQDLLVIHLSNESNENMKARIEEVMEEAEGLLSAEGVLDNDKLPDAATRFDGSLEPEEELQATLDELREAMDSQKWIEVIMLFIKFLGLKASSIFSSFGEGPSSGEEGEPQSLEDVGEGLSLSRLMKFESTEEIKANVNTPGGRVAAAAVLGVRKDTKADHCSDWVDTIAKTVHGSGRYYNTQNAYVNPDISKYRGWANRSKNKVNFSTASFKPGDMVIARSSGSPTGFHDQIVVDTDPEKGILVASQERLDRRKLRWKRFTEDDVAVISRPGWTGPSSDADLLS